jgi:transposase InsO family protein
VNGIKILNGVPYASRCLLINRGVSADTAKYWAKPAAGVERIELGGATYYRYESLPIRTRRKLPWLDAPALLQAVEDADRHALGVADAVEVYNLSQQLRRAAEKDVKNFYKLYLSQCGHERAMHYGRQHSFWAKLLEVRPRYTVAQLFEAYKLVEPDGYSSENSLGNALRHAKKVGLEKFVRHGNEGNQHAKTTLPEHEHWVRVLVSMGRGFEAPYIFREVNKACLAAGVRPLGSVSWVTHYLNRPEVRADIDAYRYGTSYARQQQPFLTMQTALFANDQWQIDGWTVPFYHLVKRVNRKGQTVSGWEKLTVFVVRDAHSRRALGYSFGATENTALIMEALRHAVERSGRLPAEIVSDNHSFNETQEAANFKDLLLARGTEWTKTSNPQYKSIVERYFEHFDTVHCKAVTGWAGGSPRNRKRNARPTDEQKTELLKPANCLSADQVKNLVARLLEEFNETPLAVLGNVSPAAAYARSEQPNAPQADAADVMRLFWKTTRCQVRQGIVTLERSGEKHRYYLPAGDTFRRWYRQEVEVRYDDDYATAYLFDPATGALICECGKQQPTHGAKANQTPADMARLAEHKQRQQLNQQASRRANEVLRDEVDERHGEQPYELLNPVTTPKEILLSAEAEYEVGQVLKRAGVSLATLPDRPQLDPLKGTVYSRAARAPRSSQAGGLGRVGQAFSAPGSLAVLSQQQPDEDE